MPKSRSSGACRALIALSVLPGLLVGGCAAPTPAADSPDQRPLVLTTFSVLADLVDTVGGGHVRVDSITKVGAEIHGYEPTPSDLVRAQDADLIVDNGLGLERWFERFLRSVDAPHVVLSDGVDPMDIRSGDYSGLPNPHAWMSPNAAATYVDNAVDALSDLEPGYAADFEANGELLKDELAALLADFRAGLADADASALVTCEGAFSYLARDAGLEEAFLWPVNSDSEGTPRQIGNVIEFVEEHRVPTVFCESTINPSAQEQVALATGAILGGTLYVDSLSTADGPVPTFVDLLRHDLDTITEGLTR